MVKILGINDESVTCECCGRTNLKRTVILDFPHKGIMRYGVACAANALGKKETAIKNEADNAEYLNKLITHYIIKNEDLNVFVGGGYKHFATEAAAKEYLAGKTFKASIIPCY